MHVTLTGAGGGIGRLVATRLAEAGHDVLGLDRDPDRLDALPDTVETVRVDVRDEIAVRELLADRPIDCVISAVGWYELGALEDVSPAAFRRHLETNLTGVHTVVHAAMPTLRRREGRVVALGSVAGTVALPYHGPYSAAKAGLDGYIDALQREVSPHGVTVSLVEPGPARTGLNERATETLEVEDDRRRRGPYAEQYAAFDGYSPESVPPETVAETVVEAATTGSPRSRYRVGRRARWLPWLATVLPDPLVDRIIRSGLPGGLLGRLVDR